MDGIEFGWGSDGFIECGGIVTEIKQRSSDQLIGNNAMSRKKE